MWLAPEFDATRLSRIEDAGLNASAPRQQRWLDGWLLRLAPGKAKRARCINAVAAGRLPLEYKLQACRAVFRDAGLPMVVRITPFSQPPDLDAALAARGLLSVDDTRVMVRGLAGASQAQVAAVLPAGWRLELTELHRYAEIVGRLRGSTHLECTAHAERLNGLPVPCRGFVLRRDADDSFAGIGACGLIAHEADVAGLYDVITAPVERGRGLATALCAQLLHLAHAAGASSVYLQVDNDNAAARSVYRRLGFTDGYAYHYRTLPAA